MNKINDGGPAFPGPDQAEQSVDIHEGMSLRDYFAAKAMGAFCEGAEGFGGATEEFIREQFYFVARVSYIVADAMLRARGEA
ncbi:hypothetical protein KTF21_11920 [Burkholderia multivorans]|uniref:hypothetical protein n=1 Tax=Burkholderia multivorans TaxID=87883 RepID=UPI001C243483|nr:hypothetical protein [Burkholderia multivorans]MBU9649388.1 hypothetical protein [Burkholderia multivorans]